MSQNPKATKNPLHDNFANLAQDVMRRFHVPGISVGVILNDQIYTAAYGYSVLPDKAVTSETLFPCGSTTKSFTTAALALMMEAEKHKDITWNTTIASIIREDFVLQDESIMNQVTLEDAACHRSSIPGHDMCYGDADQCMADVVRRLRYLPLTKAPFRTKFEYSNMSYVALSLVIEKLSGMSLEEYLREKIWSPLGMNATFFGDSKLEERAAEKGLDLARGYYWSESEQTFLDEPQVDLSIGGGCGANVSNVLDYLKYLQMMLKRSGPLSENVHSDLRRPRICTPYPHPCAAFAGPISYALGWVVEVYRGHEFLQHSGGVLSFTSIMFYVPSLSLGMVLLANATQSASSAMVALLYSLVDDILDIPPVERFDFIKHGEEKIAKGKVWQEKIRSSLYGDIATDKLMALPLSAYEGTYTSSGYQTLTFKIAKQSTAVPQMDLDKQVLRAEDSLRKLWPHIVELEHVNRSFFIAWILSCRGGEKKCEELLSGVKAEFKVEANGNVSALGIAMEASCGDEMIWFVRIP